jgi:serine/threonine-protein kinase
VLRRRRRLPPDEVARLLARVAAALDACHDANVVHRDLKPSNVMLVDGRLDDVRLLDFGVGRLVEPGPDDAALTRALAIIGTPGYLAPEQVRPTLGAIGTHTDVFALGAIVYRALTGVAAFPSHDPAAAMDEAVHLHPPPPSRRAADLPPDLDLVLALALAKSPAQRYARAGAFAADFADALAGTLRTEVRERAERLPGRRTTPSALEPTVADSTILPSVPE